MSLELFLRVIIRKVFNLAMFKNLAYFLFFFLSTPRMLPYFSHITLGFEKLKIFYQNICFPSIVYISHTFTGHKYFNILNIIFNSKQVFVSIYLIQNILYFIIHWSSKNSFKNLFFSKRMSETSLLLVPKLFQGLALPLLFA